MTRNYDTVSVIDEIDNHLDIKIKVKTILVLGKLISYIVDVFLSNFDTINVAIGRPFDDCIVP